MSELEELLRASSSEEGHHFSVERESTVDVLKPIVESIIFSAGKPISIEVLQALLEPEYLPTKPFLRNLLEQLKQDYEDKGIELVDYQGLYRFQSRPTMSEWVQRLWEEKPQKYSRALLETLALIAYRQPITRGDIEEVRGVAVSSTIMKTLVERNWVRVIGHREVPGRPAIYATTKQFLAYFNLSTLDDLPTLAEIRDIDLISKEVNAQMDLMGDSNQPEESDESETPDQ
jgi:segregation and condensation protein B